MTPLKNKVTELEKAISGFETRIAEYEKQLETLAHSGQGIEIQRISQELAKARRELQESMTSWEQAEKEREDAERAFEARIAEFAS